MVAAGGAALAAGPVAAVGAVAGQPGRGGFVAVAGQGSSAGAGVQGSMWVLVVSATMSPCLRDLTFLMVQRGKWRPGRCGTVQRPGCLVMSECRRCRAPVSRPAVAPWPRLMLLTTVSRSLVKLMRVRHEALFDRTGVKGPRRLAVAAAGLKLEEA